MSQISEKVYLIPQRPTEDMPTGDRERLLAALEEQGYGDVELPLAVLRQLSPLIRGERGITVALARRERGWAVTGLEAGDCRERHYALAVDLGSTTVVMALTDLRSGNVLEQVSAVNGQVLYGTDILSRITFAKASGENSRLLRQAVTGTLGELLDRLEERFGADVRKSPVMILSGNTTMIHLLLELDAWTVFASPYAPVTTEPGCFWARELGIGTEGLVWIVPAASNYVGGDVVSGLLALDFHRRDDPALFFDIGTNGELAIGCRDWIMAGAGAAGPALEGYISPYGMRAAEGAIDSVQIREGAVRFTTLGGKAPVGICGSGIVSLIAQLRLKGWADLVGNLDPQAPGVQWLEERQEYGIVLGPVRFSQTDIHQYLDTKAAAFTMIECLLEAAGLEARELERLYLTGGFAVHSDLESAVAVGMLPDLPRERYVLRENTSLEGARRIAMDASLLEEARSLCRKMYCVQFASVPDILVRMRAAKAVPHTDPERFPSVLARLRS